MSKTTDVNCDGCHVTMSGPPTQYITIDRIAKKGEWVSLDVRLDFCSYRCAATYFRRLSKAANETPRR